MIISHSHKFIFIKTKKTAGSTIESIIYNKFFDSTQDVCTGSEYDGTPRVNNVRVPNQPDGHKSWRHIKSLVTEEQWSTYTKFTVERNPYAKVVSDFYWKKERGEAYANRYNDDVLDFQNYMDNYVEMMGPMCWDLYASDHTLHVDTILRQETLAQEMCTFFNEKLNLPLSESDVTNTRKKGGIRKKSYEELITRQKDVEKINKLFYREFNLLEYTY